MYPTPLHPSYPESLLSCITPVLHHNSHLPCIPPILNPYFPASHLSCITIHTCPASLPSSSAFFLYCIPSFLHPSSPRSFLLASSRKMSEPKVRNILFQLISQLCTWKQKKCMRKFYFAPYFLHYRYYLFWPDYITCIFSDLVTSDVSFLTWSHGLWPDYITCIFSDLVTSHANSLTWSHHMPILWTSHVYAFDPYQTFIFREDGLVGGNWPAAAEWPQPCTGNHPNSSGHSHGGTRATYRGGGGTRWHNRYRYT